jgi:MOSC domain-containing protein YiiM
MQHYDHWNDFYGLIGTDRALGPGSLGENWTLIDADEAEICIGDVYRVGGARVQVSGARIPCGKQVRKTGLSDFRERTLETLRLGFYLRVLAPGIVAAGDGWILDDRPQPTLALRIVNACAHHGFDRELAQQLVGAPELSASWRQIFQARLESSRTD